MNLKKALKQIKEYDCRMSSCEEWIQDFVEELIYNFEGISTLNFTYLEVLDILLKKNDVYDEKDIIEKEEVKLRFKHTLEYFKKHKKEMGIKYLEKEYKKAKKLEKFFAEWE